MRSARHRPPRLGPTQARDGTVFTRARSGRRRPRHHQVIDALILHRRCLASPSPSTASALRSSATHALLLDVLRDRLDLKGAKRSCDMQVCGPAPCWSTAPGERMQLSGRRGRRPRGPHRGRAGHARRAAPAAAGLRRSRRRAVRLLHLGHAAVGQGALGRAATADGGGRAASPPRQTSAGAPATGGSWTPFSLARAGSATAA